MGDDEIVDEIRIFCNPQLFLPTNLCPQEKSIKVKGINGLFELEQKIKLSKDLN